MGGNEDIIELIISNDRARLRELDSNYKSYCGPQEARSHAKDKV